VCPDCPPLPPIPWFFSAGWRPQGIGEECEFTTGFVLKQEVEWSRVNNEIIFDLSQDLYDAIGVTIQLVNFGILYTLNYEVTTVSETPNAEMPDLTLNEFSVIFSPNLGTDKTATTSYRLYEIDVTDFPVTFRINNTYDRDVESVQLSVMINTIYIG
jgi:hypothetical protein